MTPLDAETQRILKWADEWIDDFDGYPSHLILMRDHIRALSERLARVEAETREKCAAMVEGYFYEEKCGPCHLGMGDVRMTAGMQEELAAAIRAVE